MKRERETEKKVNNKNQHSKYILQKQKKKTEVNPKTLPLFN